MLKLTNKKFGGDAGNDLMKQVKGTLISEVLLELYSVPEDGDFFKHVLSVLNGCIRSKLAGYSFTNLHDGKLQRIASQGTLADKVPDLDELDHILQSHPFREYYCTNQSDPVICTTDIMSEEEWKQTPFYNEILRPIGLIHDTSVRFYAESLCVSFTFSDANPMPSDKLRLLRLVAPHLSNAYASFMSQRIWWAGNLPDHIVSLSREGKLLHITEVDRAILDQSFPHRKTTVKWTLPDEVAQWITLAIRAHISAPEIAPRKLMATDSKGSLYLTLIHHHNGYYIILEKFRHFNKSNILQKMGLTPREAEVLLWAARGKQNDSIASILDIRVATVRKHMEHILQKLDSETRGAAAQIAMRVLNTESSHAIHVECLNCTNAVCTHCPHQ